MNPYLAYALGAATVVACLLMVQLVRWVRRMRRLRGHQAWFDYCEANFKTCLPGYTGEPEEAEQPAGSPS